MPDYCGGVGAREWWILQFNMAELLKESVGSTRSYEIDDSFPPLEETHIEGARGSVKFTRTNRSILVAACIEATAQCGCSRCLTTYSQPIHIEIEEEYFPTVDMATGKHLNTPEEPGSAFTIDEHHVIDLTEAIRQYAIVSLPMKPLCSVACRGICSGCGVNLNEGECLCDSQARNPKWEPLLKVFSG